MNYINLRSLRKLHEEIGVTTRYGKWSYWVMSNGTPRVDYSLSMGTLYVTKEFAIHILRRVYACNASSKLLKLKCMNKIIELGGRLF
jgi:hypothetical protein